MARRRKLGSVVPVCHVYYKLFSNVDYKDDTAGMTHIDSKGKRIEISKTQDEPAVWSCTFWHEFFHAAFNELGYARDMDNEAKVEGLAHAMMAMVTDPHGRHLLKSMLKHVPEKK